MKEMRNLGMLRQKSKYYYTRSGNGDTLKGIGDNRELRQDGITIEMKSAKSGVVQKG